MKKQNTSGFSIIIAILLVIVMTLLVFYILEYIIPYSKNVKWIENSSNAFYQSDSAIEESLYFFKTRSGSTQFNDKSTSFSTDAVDSKYTTVSSWSLIPYNWEWNSSYSGSYNIISIWNPVQLDVWGITWFSWSNSNTRIYFQVPKIKTWSNTLSWWTLAIINWQITAENDTLNATGSWIKANEINGSWIDMSIKQWQDLDWNEDTTLDKFWRFYNDNCSWTSWCILKMSIINKLELNSNSISVPYIEYKITTNKDIPLRYSRIKAKWKSYGFQKSLEVRVPQQTTNEAFDFTVFQ